MTKLFTQNKKMAKSTTGNYLVFNFGIPAYLSSTGPKTCPMAGTCAKGCYARQGAYVWSNVSQAFEARLALSQTDEFIGAAIKELELLQKRAKKQNKTLVIRVHDSGDFYNIDYLNKWLYIMANFPAVKFYSYTKMLPLTRKYFAKHRKPQNFRLIQSEGGLADHQIDTNDYHSRVFATIEELTNAGYADASSDDLVAALGDNPKIGLVYHGAKSKAWTTDKTTNKDEAA